MPLNLGSSALSKVALGGATLKSIYKGASLVWNAVKLPPVVASGVVTLGSIRANSITINMPSGIIAGDLLLVLVSGRDMGGITWPTGWAAVANSGLSNNSAVAAGCRVADGSEGATISVTFVNNVMPPVYAMRITGANNSLPVEGVGAYGGGSNTADPPALTPSWGSANNLWMVASTTDNGNRIVTTWSSGYTDNQYTNYSSDASFALGSRNLSAATDDPSSVTWPAGRASALTLAIQPA